MFKLQFGTGNAAFDDGDCPHEAARILRMIAHLVGDGQTSGVIRDSNGNRIGEWELTQ